MNHPGLHMACAKINLTLEVLGRRDDGYHEIASVLQLISLCDSLGFESDPRTVLSCNIPQLATPGNLVFKAARLMRRKAAQKHGVSVSISKSIPPASGLGGGSSDAAAAMLALNVLWEVDASGEELMDWAAEIGSDVPFFVSNYHTALARGRGETILEVTSPPPLWAVLLAPPIDVPGKTAEMYGRLEPSLYTTGEYSGRLVDMLTKGGSPDNDVCYNVFEGVALSFFSGLEDYRRRFLAAGADKVHVAGAGPTLFTLVPGRAEAGEIFSALRKDGLPVYLARTL